MLSSCWPLVAGELCQRPLGVGGDYRVFVLREAFEQREEAAVAAIAHGDDGVAADSGILGTLDGRAAELLLEVFARHLRQPGERRVDQLGGGGGIRRAR